MADNYLERQREQYEARKAAWLKMKKYGKKKPAATHTVKSEQAVEAEPKVENQKREQ